MRITLDRPQAYQELVGTKPPRPDGQMLQMFVERATRPSGKLSNTLIFCMLSTWYWGNAQGLVPLTALKVWSLQGQSWCPVDPTINCMMTVKTDPHLSVMLMKVLQVHHSPHLQLHSIVLPGQYMPSIAMPLSPHSSTLGTDSVIDHVANSAVLPSPFSPEVLETWDSIYWTVSTLLSSVTTLRGLNNSFSVYPEETHFLGHADGILLFWIVIGISPVCFHFNRILSSQNAPVSKQVKKGGAVVSNDGVQHSEDMIGKPKPWHAVQPPEGWEEHMFGLRDRRCSLTPCPSIANTPMLPSPSLHMDNQIHDEDSAMEEMEENPDNNKNEDDQPSSNKNEDDQPSGSKNEDDLPSSSEKEDDWLPGSNDDDKGSNYNENENDDEMESSNGSHDNSHFF
ncbi:hypothetical protein F5J12DRAFT_784501 [Pisolithus orientalis]|uniref:uncharacterized protein n=1 Tax=Pisolithus orientalis TaxID=936130 RepID=UPI0022243D1F|nr:uncharacterized protein F5J12DRAFT_784501 [Pisolithus orientalis]KAI6000197.1 hypothetical protein F5J12DRAFT_784501 [Pisolithus orientalis]